MAVSFNSVVSAVRNLFRRGGSSVVRFFANVGNPEVYVDINTEKAISEGYNGNSAVYAIISKDAQKFASVKQYLYKKDDTETMVENDLSKLLNKPNENEGAGSFREKARTYYKLTGEAIIWLNRGVMADDQYNELTGKYEPIAPEKRMKMPVLEMHVLPSDHMILIPDPNDVFGHLGWYFEVNGQKQYIPKEDVLHWKNVSLEFDGSTRQHLRGRSPLASGYKTLQQNNSATDAAVRMYQNDGAKGVLYNESLTDLTVVQQRQIDSVVDRKINSSDVKGAVAKLPGKWGHIDLGKGSTDLQLLEGKKISMQELCFLFDLPYEMFDSQTTFANKEQAQKNWVINSIIPACKQFDEELNRVLLPAFNLDGVEIETDTDDMPEMKEDLDKKITALLKLWPLTPNQVLEECGYPVNPDPRFNEPWVPSGMVPISQTGLSMDQIAADLAAQGLND